MLQQVAAKVSRHDHGPCGSEEEPDIAQQRWAGTEDEVRCPRVERVD